MNPLMITASALVIGAIFASAALARDTCLLYTSPSPRD